MDVSVMIVDDEMHIRNGIKMKVDWERHGMRVMAEASDGLEALSIIENDKIDLVITDINMPLMDGLTFIQKALEINGDVKFIIVSGYSEFEYARRAMKFGIKEYLLKPLKETDIHTSLMKMKDEILATVSVKEHAKHENNKRREELLLHMLTDIHAQSTIADLERELNLDFDSNSFLIGVIKTDLLNFSADSAGRVRNLTLHHEIEKAFSILLAHWGSGHIIKCSRPEHEFVLLLQPWPFPNGKEKFYSELNACIRELERQLEARVTIGFGGTYQRELTIKPSYQEALFAVKERILHGTGIVLDYANIVLNREKPNFSAEIKSLIRYLEERKWDNVKEHLEAIFRHSIQKGTVSHHTQVYELFIEIYFAIKQFARGATAADQQFPIMDFGEDITAIVGGFSHTKQMVEWLYTYTELACRHLKEGQDATGREIVFRVKKYIKEFYSSDLTLNRVSEKYHINPIYFSRIFKLYTGESFNSCMTRTRMEEAKNLMETTSLKMQEISEIVGYEDPKYFSKVFKKYFGISPSLYTDPTYTDNVRGKNQ
jgi:two-component system response regulator YesN